MGESPRHLNSNSRIERIAEAIGAEVMVNTQDGGRNGFALPPIICPDNKVRRFIVDKMVRMPGGLMTAFEVDFNHPTTLVKRRMLHELGYVVVIATPESVDLWEQDHELFQREVEYRYREQFGKRVIVQQEAR